MKTGHIIEDKIKETQSTHFIKRPPYGFQGPSNRGQGRAHSDLGAEPPCPGPYLAPHPVLQAPRSSSPIFLSESDVAAPQQLREGTVGVILVFSGAGAALRRGARLARGVAGVQPGLPMTYLAPFSPSLAAAAPEAHRHRRPEPATHRKSGALIVRCSPLCHTLAVIFGWGPRRSALIGGCECQPLCMLQLGKHCGTPVTRTLGPVTACDSAVAEGREANFQTTDVCNRPGAPWNHTLSFCSWTCGCFFLHHDGSSRKNLVRSILCSITSSIRTHINSSIEAQWKMYSITDEIDIVNSDLCGTLYVSIY